MSELNLEQIAGLIHEYRELIKKRAVTEDRSRLSRIDYLLRQVTLTGEQIMEMQSFDPLALSNEDVKRSAVYGELKEWYDQLQRRYSGLERRYDKLVRKVEEELGPQFRLKDLIEKQRDEVYREGFGRD